MPDKHRFDHLPDRGEVTVRCIEEGCGVGGPLHKWPERERRRHARAHEIERKREVERKRNDALREARRLKRQRDRENQEAYG